MLHLKPGTLQGAGTSGLAVDVIRIASGPLAGCPRPWAASPPRRGPRTCDGPDPPGRELRRNTPAHRGRVRLPLAVGLCPARDRRKRQSPGRLRSPGAELREGRDLGGWLIRALIARRVLASYLAHEPSPGDLAPFLARVVDPPLRGGTQVALLRQALSELGAGRITPRPSFAALQELYKTLTGVSRRPFPDSLDDVQAADTIASVFPQSGRQGPTPEMRFVAGALSYMEGSPTDTGFASLFWQVVRVRALFYRHITQRPMTPGMLWFIRFYGRLGAARRHLVGPRLQLQAAANLQGLGRGLRSLEMRTSPDSTMSRLLEYVKGIDSAARDLIREGKAGPDFEYGLVLHFTKDRGSGALSGVPTADWQWSAADPGVRFGPETNGNPSGYRYSHFFVQKRAEASPSRDS